MKQNYKRRRLSFKLASYFFMLVAGFTSLGISAQTCVPPGVNITAPGVLTCTNRTITLNGGSPTIGASLVWTGPHGFTSFSTNPLIAFPGKYKLTVTSPTGGCTSADSIVVVQDTVQPNASTHVSGMVTCTSPTSEVDGLSTTPGVSYSWIGPGTFTSTLQKMLAVGSGGYTLMVTGQNGCTTTAVAYVDKNVQLPTASAYVSGNLTCVVNSVKLTSSSATSGVTYSWTGPGFISPLLAQNTTTSTNGTYTVTTTNPVNGCQSSSSVNVVLDNALPGAIISASANTITCAVNSSSLLGSSPTIGVSYNWTGPSLNRATQNTTASRAGTYTLTVKGSQNGCVSTATQVITMDRTFPDALATVSSPITCTTSVVNLTGSSNTPNVTYIWYGPSQFGTLSGQTQTTYTPGGYVLGVENQNNGCITTTAVDVIQDVTLPVSVSASTNGTITCTNANVTLTGYSSTSGAIYAWNGPNGTSFTGTNPAVSIAGTYTLTVTDPTNGCSASTTTLVAQDKTRPTATATNNGPVTCLLKSITLSGSSSTSGATFQWKDQNGNVISSSQNTSVSESGMYSLVVTNPSNGCIGANVTFVDLNIAKPEMITASNSGPLTCSLLSTSLDASSATTGVSYSWTGPGFSSTTKDPIVSTPGNYTVTIQNTQNGCTDTTSTYLAQNVVLPGAAIATAPTITCSSESVTISASSLTSGVTYNWTGPLNFTSSEQNPETNKMGSYTVTVTNPVNNCKSYATTTIAKDTIAPAGVTASAPNALTCTRTLVSLAALSTDNNVTYSWSGPGGYTSSSQNPVTALKGNYAVTVTKVSNGCQSFANATVLKDTVAPVNVSAVASGILNCANTNVTLTASTLTNGVAYSWTGAGLGSSTTTQSVTTSTVGVYNVTVTNTVNGCYSIASVTVEQDHTIPASVVASSLATLTCSSSHTTVTASSATSGVVFGWTGPGNMVSNEQTPTVGNPGTYTVTVTDVDSKCSVTATTIVTQDTISPADVSASYSDIISCYSPTITLTGYSSTTGVIFNWTGPNNYIQLNIESPVVGAGGDYILTAINPANGCSQVRTLTLPVDTASPANVTATASGKLTCTSTSVVLTASTSTQDAVYEWDTPSGNYITASPTVNVISAGNYTLYVTNNDNGCTVIKTVAVLTDKTLPTVTLNVSNNSTVLQQSTNTIGATNVSTYVYAWSITNWNAISGQTTPTFTYKSGITGSTSKITLNLKDNNNGCTNSYNVNLSAVGTKSGYVEEGQPTVETVTDLLLSSYPVPSAGKVFVEFTSPDQTDATVTVYNIRGSMVASLFNGHIEAKQDYKLVFNESESLPSGVYICVIKTNTKTMTNKILIK